MIIKDPANLLDLRAIPDRECLPGMVLEIPPHGVAIHPTSIKRLVEEVMVGEWLLMLQPQLPVSSQLGLSPYPVLAYLYPEEFSPFLQDLSVLSSTPKSSPLPFKVIDHIEEEEALHYFAKYYGKAVKPNFVRVIIGNTCNLQCVMCPFHGSVLKPKQTNDFFKKNRAMSWEMMKRFAEDCGKWECPVLIGIMEEPLLHPDLYRFIRHCRQAGAPKVHITTNGQLLNEERSRLLLEAGLTGMDISLDAADPDTYYQIRGSDFHRVEANINNFLKLRDRLKVPCEVRTSLIRSNPGISPEAEAKFKQKWLGKVDSLYITNLAKYQDGNMRVNKNKIGNLMQHRLQQSSGRWPCIFPFTEMAVLPDGRVYYCIETLFRLGFDPVESMGDFCTQSLSEIWEGEAFQEFRQDLILDRLHSRGHCQNCQMWRTQVIAPSSQEDMFVMKTEVTEIYQTKVEYLQKV
jgi:radical SAM protein with 4Fe4S-binding SPASM domain